MVTDSRNGMVNWKCSHFPITKAYGGTYFDRHEAHKRLLGVGQAGEIWPDRPVEDMLLQDLDDFRQGIDKEWPLSPCGNCIDQQRQSQHMIKMGMRQKNMVDCRQLGERQFGDASSGIDQDIVVDQKRGGPQMPAADTAATAEYAQLHARDT